MPKIPYLQPADRFEFTNRILDNTVGANSRPNEDLVQNTPPYTGQGSRQALLQSRRLAKKQRHVIKWLVAEQPLISMYINPQSISFSDSKIIQSQQTKGGFSLQYWGENLTKIQLSGTTGTSGIEGINVLEDVYRNEQFMFDPFALYLESQRQVLENEDLESILLGPNNFGVIGDVVDSIKAAQRGTMFVNKRSKPTLANLAFGVQMFYNGVTYKGYFESFSVRESVDNLGMFNYDISFVSYEKRGLRTNSFAWQKSPLSGTIDAPPKQRPYSYSRFEGDNFYPPGTGGTVAFTDDNTRAEDNAELSKVFQETTSQATKNKNIKNSELARIKIDPFDVF